MDVVKDTVSVKWWNHRSALCRSIRDIYMKNLYTDVKLVCDGQEHCAHRFVLSACSEYFETVLVDVPYQGSVNLAPSIRQKELLALLDFMYLGIVDVLQHELPSLVAAAEVLMIKGLAVPYEDDDDDDDDSEEELASLKKETKTEVTKIKSETQGPKGNPCKRQKANDLETETSIKVEEESFDYCSGLNQTSQLVPSTSSKTGTVLQRSPDQNCQVTSSNAEVNAMLKVLIGKTPKGERKKLEKNPNDKDVDKQVGTPDAFICCTCQKIFQWRSNLTKHMRTHTGEKPYSCSVCSYRTSYSEALKRHMRIHTGEKPYQCEYCDYKSRDHGSLKVHLKRHSMSSGNPPSGNTQQDSKLVIHESVSSSDLMLQHNDTSVKSHLGESIIDPLIRFNNTM